jgi:excisionase family DNA binding protein
LTARDRLAAALAPELLSALEQLVDERVDAAVTDALADRGNGAVWLTLKQAASRLACSPDAVRMRVKRGRLEARRQGRRVYVSAASVERLA